MGHPARRKKKSKRVLAQPATPVQDPQPEPVYVTNESLAGLNLTDAEWDSLFCMAVRHHFEQETVWVPSVLRTMALLEGINDKTGRPCRIYVRPGKRLVMVETL